ncbi:hypothetical protein VIGAN_04024500, partial [Vigna angularis var. angularis]
FLKFSNRFSLSVQSATLRSLTLQLLVLVRVPNLSLYFGSLPLAFSRALSRPLMLYRVCASHKFSDSIGFSLFYFDFIWFFLSFVIRLYLVFHLSLSLVE